MQQIYSFVSHIKIYPFPEFHKNSCPQLRYLDTQTNT